MKLWLDDTREAPDGWTLVQTASQMIVLIAANWDHLELVSLDHDLGTELDGMDVLNAIEEMLQHRLTLPFRIHIHSMNVAERPRMVALAAMLMQRYGNERLTERVRKFPRFEDESWTQT
jgi:hypothetical protein